MNAEKQPEEAAPSQSDATPESLPTEANPSLPASPEAGQIVKPVVVLRPKETSKPVLSSPGARPSTTSPDRPQVHVAPNLLDLVTGRSVTPDEQQAAKEQRDLNEIVHQMLVIGLVISTALMLFGLALDLILGREVPTVVPDFGDVFNRVIALRPSGFLTLGLLVLIATPILRVVGSIFAFLYERDWRYAGITCLVLGVVMISLLLGKG
ncbi:MAG: DUF1634 domain-containing protein [Anaerolineae bacterium]|nr:DUF1634 domain-containing protein [Anaerolineae bacterium]